MKIRPEYIVFVVVLALLLFNWQCQRTKIKKLEAKVTEIQGIDSTREAGFTAERNKLSQELNSVRVMRMEYDEMSNVVIGQQTTIRQLQKIVNDKTSLAIYYKNQIGDSITVKTDTMILIGEGDPPVYQTRIEERWIEADIMMGPDVTNLEYTIFNEHAFNVSYKKQEGTFAFLKKKELILDVQSINPNVKTTGVTAWSPPKQKTRQGWWLGGGLVIGVGGVLWLLSATK